VSQTATIHATNMFLHAAQLHARTQRRRALTLPKPQCQEHKWRHAVGAASALSPLNHTKRGAGVAGGVVVRRIPAGDARRQVLPPANLHACGMRPPRQQPSARTPHSVARTLRPNACPARSPAAFSCASLLDRWSGRQGTADPIRRLGRAVHAASHVLPDKLRASDPRSATNWGRTDKRSGTHAPRTRTRSEHATVGHSDLAGGRPRPWRQPAGRRAGF